MASAKGRPKGDKRERTRAALIEAAGQVIGEKGFERASLEEVAARAGMTRGAIYGNFKSKEELLLAFVGTHWRPLAPPLKKGAPLKEQLRIIARATAQAADERRAIAVGALSFQIYALTHEAVQREMAAGNVHIYRAIEKALAEFIDPAELPMPLGRFVRVLHALSDGLMFQRFLDPDQFPDAVFISAFEALAP
ncbi:MAG TPA: helix-turn-helix domain-containing protein [Hyphomonadaceae bacterium]|nr:helix-turn-helix domain-containing protein [Hyphomonadaceae bacterium]